MDQLVTSYYDPHLVGLYAQLKDLFPPERTLLAAESAWLGGVAMLDIGVGAGRTTRYFAPAVKSYLGIDNAPQMIDLCRREFAALDHASFAFLDARAMRELADASFDFVMFSFNGIDCVDWDGREQILREIERVIRPGGKFFFSFHNARDLRRIYAFRFRRDPRSLLAELKGWWKIRRINGPMRRYQDLERFRLFDGGDDFRTRGSFIVPQLQRQRLLAAGWSQLRSYDMWTGEEIASEAAFGGDQPWVYVFCTMQPGGGTP